MGWDGFLGWVLTRRSGVWGWSDGVLSGSDWGWGGKWGLGGMGEIRYLRMLVKTQAPRLGSSVDRCFFTRGPWWTVNQGSVDRYFFTRGPWWTVVF